MTSLAFISFIAGMLTILAPCVLPVLPVILAGSLTEKKSWYPYIVTVSLAISIVIFTLLLKVSTIFIDIPSSFWKYVSGGILVFLGIVTLFPHLWVRVAEVFKFSKSNATLDTAQDIGNPILRAIVTGSVLGPVFSTCSPTYTLLLATVFPVSLISGVGYTLIYTLGLSFMLILITLGGRKIMSQFRFFADEQGRFKRILGIIFLLVGVAIVSGFDKKIEAAILQKYDIPSIETNVINYLSPNITPMNTTTTLSSDSLDSNLRKAYFAGGCFWCMEGIFESQSGVVSATSGYAEGKEEDATYERVSAGNTAHREAIEVIYDPQKISYPTLVDLYYSQIDPTQVDGQFADTGFRYTTAIYYQNDEERSIIERAKQTIQASGKFDAPIAVQTVPFTTFFPAEEYHQDYYKKSAFRYNLYKEGSGRAGFIHDNAQPGITLPPNKQYQLYDDTILASLTGSRILLFFHADWCPTCQNFEKQILLSVLPDDVVILKVHYDTATELKKKYSILSQSTFVQIDSKGNMYKRWLGKSDISDILSDMLTSKDLLSQKLTPLQFEVTQMGGTEKSFDNAYWDNHEAGIYVDIVDGTPLFSSLDKFDSGTGWPSFTRPIDASILDSKTDTKLSMERTEIVSKNANSHLGHVFDDGPREEGGKRYCINSAALWFIPLADLEKEGYGKYISLFPSK